MLGEMVDPLSLSTERMLPGAHAGQCIEEIVPEFKNNWTNLDGVAFPEHIYQTIPLKYPNPHWNKLHPFWGWFFFAIYKGCLMG